jgi:hypothetical protein
LRPTKRTRILNGNKTSVENKSFETKGESNFVGHKNAWSNAH